MYTPSRWHVQKEGMFFIKVSFVVHTILYHFESAFGESTIPFVENCQISSYVLQVPSSSLKLTYCRRDEGFVDMVQEAKPRSSKIIFSLHPHPFLQNCCMCVGVKGRSSVHLQLESQNSTPTRDICKLSTFQMRTFSLPPGS